MIEIVDLSLMAFVSGVECHEWLLWLASLFNIYWPTGLYQCMKHIGCTQCSTCRCGGGRANQFDSAFWLFGLCVRTFQNTCESLFTVNGTCLLGKYPWVLLVLVPSTGIIRVYPLPMLLLRVRGLKHRTGSSTLFVLTPLGENVYRLITIYQTSTRASYVQVEDVLPRTAPCILCEAYGS